METYLYIFILILLANGIPIIAYDLLKERGATPVDLGKLLKLDQQPVFGASKTWRGLALSVLLTPLAAGLLQMPLRYGFIIAGTAMVGDLTSSFIKRRLKREAGSMMLGLDQIPESLFPLLALKSVIPLNYKTIVLMVCIFIIVELLLSRLLFKLHLRKHPY